MDECLSTYDMDDIYNIYYIRNTSECYCETSLNYDQCLNLTNTTDIRQWTHACCVYGRPYNIEHRPDLKADIKKINCADYNYFDDDEWREFASHNNLSDYVMTNEWLKRGLSEHDRLVHSLNFHYINE